MPRLFKQVFAFFLIFTLALTVLVACTPTSKPAAETPTPTATQTTSEPRPTRAASPTSAREQTQGPSSLTVSAAGGDLANRDTQIALLSIINWASLAEEVLPPETEVIVLVEGEAIAQPGDLASDPETLNTQLVDSQTGSLMTVSLVYPDGDDQLLQVAVSIARNLKVFGVRTSLYPVAGDRLQSFIDTHVSAGEEVLAVSR